MDNMETQPQDSQGPLTPSPIGKMRSLDTKEMDKSYPETQPDPESCEDLQEESNEEEDPTTDEEVEVVAVHDNICIDLALGEESILSPQKDHTQGLGDRDVCISAGSEPHAGAGSVDPSKKKPLPKSTEEDSGAGGGTQPFIEDILDSDEDPQSNKGVFKVGIMHAVRVVNKGSLIKGDHGWI